MSDQTPLDQAHAVMEAAADQADRLAFFDRLAEAELFVLLAREAEGDRIEPEIFGTEDGSFVLVFDLEERLASFVGRTAPYAALSGRALVGMLAGQGIGLALNPEVAPSATLLDAQAVDWLARTLAEAPAEVQARPLAMSPPRGLPERLLTALDAKLATAAGLARLAYLVAVTYEGGRAGHLLAFVDTARGAEAALARAVGEALTFSGLEAGEIDVGFFDATDPVAARLARAGLRIELPEVEVPDGPAAPGMDPDRPPKLR